MPKIFLHINQYKTSVQYFAILYAVKETYKTENTYTLTNIWNQPQIIILSLRIIAWLQVHHISVTLLSCGVQ